MSGQKLNTGKSILLVIVIIVAALRLITHFADHSSLLLSLTPIGAMALFGGAYFNGNLKSLLFTLLPLFLSDVILCFTVYSDYREGLLYPGWFWVYAAFSLMVLIGKWITKEPCITSICVAVISATIIHWTVGNAGECLTASSEQNFIQLFGQRLITGISYELKFMLGTTVYSLLMFGSFELIQKKYSRLRIHEPAS